MRLTCPNCGAQYEVPPEAIPPAGRDVQCSACSHTWFVQPPAPEPLPDPEPWDLVRRVTEDDEEADDLAEAEVAPLAEPATAPGPTPRSTVTPEVAAILRAEAESEARVRAEPAPATAPVVPAPAPVIRPAAPVQQASDESLWPEPEPIRPARVPERRLDLDQINSSLRTTNDRIGGRAPQVRTARRSGGFARGFWGAILVLAVLAGLYLVAPTVMEAMPQSNVVLEPYVETVKGARAWLDRQVDDWMGNGASTD